LIADLNVAIGNDRLAAAQNDLVALSWRRVIADRNGITEAVLISGVVAKNEVAVARDLVSRAVADDGITAASDIVSGVVAENVVVVCWGSGFQAAEIVAGIRANDVVSVAEDTVPRGKAV